ncbi:ribokinase [Actinobacillus equuli]|nr:ribokinase [Actinobacillus equuli]
MISAGANAKLDESVVAQHQATIESADCLLVQLETPLQAVKKH